MPLQSLKVVTPKEVPGAIYRPNPDKAPGINGLPNQFLRLVLEVFLPHFTYFFQACIDLEYYPKKFWIANMIVLKKPRRENYTLTESYCPIALLNTLYKALKAILACRLSGLAEAKNLLSPQQMKAQKSKSTETALEMLIESIHTVWDCNRKNVASVLSLNVAAIGHLIMYPTLNCYITCEPRVFQNTLSSGQRVF